MLTGIANGMGDGIGTGLNPSGSVARAWPTSAAEHTAAYPGIVAPTAIYSAQDSSGPALDGVGSVDLAAVSTPVFGATGEAGRLAIEFDSNLDALEPSLGSSFNPDGSKDMTYLARVFIPSYVDANNGIIAKRGGTGFAGWSIFLDSSGYIDGVQDGGSSGRQDFSTPVQFDHQEQWVDIAYIVEGTARVGRIETTLGTTTQTLSGIASLGSTYQMSVGRAAGEGRGGLVGMLLGYGRVWDGTALTRGQFLTVTS